MRGLASLRALWTFQGFEFRAFGWPPVFVGWDAAVFPLLMTFPLWAKFTSAGWSTAAIVAPALLLSLLAHELGHAFAARRCGFRPYRIDLHLTGGLMSYEADRVSIRDERVVTIAGPAVNLVIGIAFLAVHSGLGWLLASSPEDFEGVVRPAIEPFYVKALLWIGWTNVMLGLVNLLPAYPLDGGVLADGFIRSRWGEDVALFWIGASGVAFAVLSILATFAFLLFGGIMRFPPGFSENIEAIERSKWRPWRRRADRKPLPPPPPRGADLPEWLKQPNAPAAAKSSNVTPMTRRTIPHPANDR